MTRPKITTADEVPGRKEGPGERSTVLFDRSAVGLVDQTSTHFNIWRAITFQRHTSTPTGSKLAIAGAQAVAGVAALLIAAGVAAICRWVGTPSWLTLVLAILAGAGYMLLYIKDTRHLVDHPTRVALADKTTGEQQGAPLPVKSLKIHKTNARRHRKGGKRK